MKLMTNILENDINFNQGVINIIEFNEMHVFRRFVHALYQGNQIENMDEEILISFDDQLINIKENCFILMDFYNFELQSSPIIKKITKLLEDEFYSNDEYRALFHKMNSSVEKFTQSLLFNIPIDLKAKKLEVRDYFKLLALKPDTSLLRTPTEKIIFFIKMSAELKLYKLLVFIDLKKYCTDAELLEIYKIALYYGMEILLLESLISLQMLKYERKLRVLEDFSEEIYGDKEE